MPKQGIDTWKLIMIGIIIVLVGSIMNWWVIPGLQQVPPTTEPPTTPPPSGEEPAYAAAQLRWTISNIINGTDVGAGTDADVDISLMSNGVWDPLNKVESLEYDASPDNTALTYAYGDELVILVTTDKDTSGGSETYPRWFYVKLIPGTTIKELTPSFVTATQTSPPYKYTVTGGIDTPWQVQYTAGTTPYWGLGSFQVYPRADGASITLQLTYSGTVLSSVTDGAAWDDQTSEINANATLATRTEDIFFDIYADVTDVVYALPVYVVAQNGQWQTYKTIATIATDGTGIGVSALAADGWKPVNKVGVTANVIFYHVVEPLIPASRGTKWANPHLEISIDSNALTASTMYKLGAWLHDCQLESNVAIGSQSSGIPTAYGMVTEYGITYIEPAAAAAPPVYTVASGAVVADTTATTEMLTTNYTTAA